MDVLYKNIKKLRTQKHMKQTELADLMGYSANTMIAHIEHGEVDLPYSKIKKFAEALDVSVPELLGFPSTDFTEKFALLSDEGKAYVSENLEFAIYKYDTTKTAAKQAPSRNKKR